VSSSDSIWGAGQYCTVTRVARTMSSAQAQTAAESFLGSVQTIALVVQARFKLIRQQAQVLLPGCLAMLLKMVAWPARTIRQHRSTALSKGCVVTLENAINVLQPHSARVTPQVHGATHLAIVMSARAATPRARPAMKGLSLMATVLEHARLALPLGQCISRIIQQAEITVKNVCKTAIARQMSIVMVTPTPASRVGHSNRTSASSMGTDVTNVQGENTMQNGVLPQAASGSAITVTTRHSVMWICSMALLVILPATATPAPGDLPHRASRRRRIAPVTLVRVMLLNEPVMRHAALAWAIRGGIGLLPRDTTVGA